ncbi:hypothetical protein FKM82_030811 [Ascaphus truei]
MGTQASKTEKGVLACHLLAERERRERKGMEAALPATGKDLFKRTRPLPNVIWADAQAGRRRPNNVCHLTPFLVDTGAARSVIRAADIPDPSYLSDIDVLSHQHDPCR